jgi:hypothetical protein
MVSRRKTTYLHQPNVTYVDKEWSGHRAREKLIYVSQKVVVNNLDVFMSAFFLALDPVFYKLC